MKNWKNRLLTFADSFEGDKVVWIILLLLMMISIVCSFSSTSRLLAGDETRVNLVKRQLMIVGAGLAIVILLYNIKNISLFRWFSKWGFLLSAVLLTILSIHKKVGPFTPVYINEAWRILMVGNIQIHVFEIVKVAMVMYLAWAQDALKRKTTSFGNTEMQKKIIYLYFPFAFVLVLLSLGSISSTIVIGGIMFLVILLGGGNAKDLLIIMTAGILILLLGVGTYKVSGGKYAKRFGTAVSRAFGKENWHDSLAIYDPGTIGRQKALDHLRQPEGALIALKEGGIKGKGPGQSTQRYFVPDMSEDYMFSFIVEEYGLIGGTFVIILYLSLLARGSIITKCCDKSYFAQLAVAGLTLLICGQAFLHIFVNLDIGPMTGQTLPLISHGNSAFICFCIAFGIILSFSRVAFLRIKRESERAEPIVTAQEDVEQGLNELDEFESGE